MIPPAIPTLGFALHFEDAPHRATALTSELVSLVTSPIWGKPLRYFSALTMPGEQEVRRPGVLTKDTLVSELTRAIVADATASVIMATSAKEDETYARFWFDTQADPLLKPLREASATRPWTPTSTHAEWLRAVLTFAERATATLGGVFVMPGRWQAASEGTLVAAMVDGKLVHPYPKQLERLRHVRKELGTRYVRFPRWGTLYSHAHVAALGGAARIVEVVQPAVVRELPGGVYFQLTDSLDTAQSEEATRKRRAFTELAEPLLPPPLPA